MKKEIIVTLFGIIAAPFAMLAVPALLYGLIAATDWYIKILSQIFAHLY